MSKHSRKKAWANHVKQIKNNKDILNKRKKTVKDSCDKTNSNIESSETLDVYRGIWNKMLDAKD